MARPKYLAITLNMIFIHTHSVAQGSKWSVNAMEEVQIVRKRSTKSYMEGDEHCRLYVKNDKILFGTSSLLPGTKGAVDPGHKQGKEIFFAAMGSVICHFPNMDTYEELEEGDAIVIPPGEPHQLMNFGNKEALVCWSLAPPV